MGSHYVAQGGLEPLVLSGAPTSASHVAGTTCAWLLASEFLGKLES